MESVHPDNSKASTANLVWRLISGCTSARAALYPAIFLSVAAFACVLGNGVAVLAVVECLRCCDGHIVGHVLAGRVCRGGGARELEPVGATVPGRILTLMSLAGTCRYRVNK